MQVICTSATNWNLQMLAKPVARTTRKFSVQVFLSQLCKMTTASAPGENFEVRQTSATEDWHPDPSKSLPLNKARQALIDDIIALYSCEPTIERVKRYTPDCVYDDQFVYSNDRYGNHIKSLKSADRLKSYKMAGQWFALPKLFKGIKKWRIPSCPQWRWSHSIQEWTSTLCTFLITAI